jgi:hypothetical protein
LSMILVFLKGENQINTKNIVVYNGYKLT